MEKPKSIRISQAAADKMNAELKDGSVWQVELSAFTWCGPAYRLVQTNTVTPTDLTLTDEVCGVTVHVPRNAAEYFEDLEIQLYSMFGDESLVVKERLVWPGNRSDF